MEGTSTPTQRNAAAEWDKANTTQVKLKLQNRTDADILQSLEEVPNKQGYIKDLIRKDIAQRATNTQQ